MTARPIGLVIGLATLVVAAAISVAAGLNNALQQGQDLQWSPARLLVDGINPYAHYLAGNPDERIILEQAPTSAHALQVMFVPLALLEFEQARLVWIICNLALSIGLAWWLARTAGAGSGEAVAFTLVFLCSTPFRTNLANGQLALVSLGALCTLLVAGQRTAQVANGLVYLKYSFALPAAVWLAASHGAAAVARSLVFPVAGFVLFLSWVGGNTFEVLLQPIRVGAVASYAGLADLMSVLPVVSGTQSVRVADAVLALVVACVIGVQVHRHIGPPMAAVALLSLGSLLCFRHLIYDWVALLPAAAWAMTHRQHRWAHVALVLVAYFWFGIKLVMSFGLATDLWLPAWADVLLNASVAWALFFVLWHGTRQVEASHA